MKIRPFSDLHCEFAPYNILPLADDKETIGVFVGDIGVLRRPETVRDVLEQASKMFRAVIYVLGNHEFYHGNFPEGYDTARQLLADLSNVHVLQNQSIVIEDGHESTAFIGATLWTDLSNPLDRLMAQRCLNDFRYIMRSPGACFLAADAHEEHIISQKYVFEQIKKLNQQGQKTVVLVHHGISTMSVHEQYKGSPLNTAFVSDLTTTVMDTQPTLIVHGHVHNHAEYMIDETRVVVNPLGYPNEPSGHLPTMVIEI